MKPRRRSSFFGGPKRLNKAQLPTYEQVGQHYLAVKQELRLRDGPQMSIANVVKQVNLLFYMVTMRVSNLFSLSA